MLIGVWEDVCSSVLVHDLLYMHIKSLFACMSFKPVCLFLVFLFVCTYLVIIEMTKKATFKFYLFFCSDM